MTLDEFTALLRAEVVGNDLRDFTNRTLLHGVPHVFRGKEDDYFSFKAKICEQLAIRHTEIFIVGSAKLGFSPHKGTLFSLDSDIDIAIVSSALWDRVFSLGMNLEYARKNVLVTLHNEQGKNYNRFLRNMAIGWARPDLMPLVLEMAAFRNEWFDFFLTLSNGRSEVGDYKVAAGIFRQQEHLERYSMNSMQKVRATLEVPARGIHG